MSQALYRRYRPDTFTEVIGQEHVTEPLMQALRADKVTHAYLFSGPRGCGKTTSARILARCLNCAEGPTATPCGRCDSCAELARGGTGSLDVVEIDAASHNGVDDARDLRERAAFAPARDRFKIFILDEAHMVTPQGFNALLKIVEEPPPHVKFIFATTEPDKVIGTIRSRTHHYPFRLVAPDTLLPYLEQMCAAEGVTVGGGVLPLVVRAGGGSVRDSLSVLDQLVAGADAAGIDYERAVALLGYTHAALLDDTVDAIAARDGASAFRVVDRVVSSGHEPRRFVEDLLERMRDLIVIAASGDAAQAVLRDLPTDQLDRMRVQASVLGASELSRSADLVNAALSEMTGATSPRLHLELLVARLLLPAADDHARGVGARLDRVERELGRSGARGGTRDAGVGAVASQGTDDDAVVARGRTVPGSSTVPAEVREARSVPTVPAEVREARSVPSGHAGVSPPDRSAPAAERSAPAAERSAPAAERSAPAAERSAPAAERSAPVPEPGPPAPAPGPGPGPGPGPEGSAPAVPVSASPAGPVVEAEMVRRRWPEVLATLRGLRMATWVLVSQNAQIAGVSAESVTLAFTTPQLATAFRVGPHAENVRRALHETLGLDVRVQTELIETELIETAPTTPPPATEVTPRRTGPVGAAGSITMAEAEASWGTPAPAVPREARAPSPRPDPGPSGSPVTSPGGDAVSPRDVAPGPHPGAPALTSTPMASDGIPDGPEPDGDVPPVTTPETAVRRDATSSANPTSGPSASTTTPSARAGFTGPSAPSAARGGPATERGSARSAATGQRQGTSRPAAGSSEEAEDASPDDPDLASTGLVGAPLIAQLLGGTVIDEIPDPPT